jgi:hypothetical protein
MVEVAQNYWLYLHDECNWYVWVDKDCCHKNTKGKCGFENCPFKSEMEKAFEEQDRIFTRIRKLLEAAE